MIQKLFFDFYDDDPGQGSSLSPDVDIDYRKEKLIDSYSPVNEIPVSYTHLMWVNALRWNFRIGVSNVGGEIRCATITIEDFTCGVLPCAGKDIICIDEFESDTGGETGEGGTDEREGHNCYVLCIQRR